MSVRVHVSIAGDPIARLLIWRSATDTEGGSEHTYCWHVLDGHGEQIIDEGAITHHAEDGALALIESVLGCHRAREARNGAR